jgi:hypothetical protein
MPVFANGVDKHVSAIRTWPIIFVITVNVSLIL